MEPEADPRTTHQEPEAAPRMPLPNEPGPVPAHVDQPVVRVGRAEREVVERRLRHALADDVLDIHEFDERLGACMAARTQAELDALVADLPPAVAPAAAQGPTRDTVIAVLSTDEQRGVWTPGKPVRAYTVLGEAVVDLRDARLADGAAFVKAVAFLGTVEVVVPDDAQVHMTGWAVLGDRDNRTDATASGGPVVHVDANAVLGSVEVRRAKPSERRRWPATGAAPPLPADPGPPASYPPRRRRWVGRVIGAAILAAVALGPGRAVLGADAIAVFGSREYTPDAAELQHVDTVNVVSLFGSVHVTVPATHSARIDAAFPIFGSVDCSDPCRATGEGEVEVDAVAVFGSVNVGRPDEDN